MLKQDSDMIVQHYRNKNNNHNQQRKVSDTCNVPKAVAVKFDVNKRTEKGGWIPISKATGLPTNVYSVRWGRRGKRLVF
jgi:hypothetical protein